MSLPQPAPGDLVQGVGAPRAIDDARVEVILQVLADPRQIVDHYDAVLLQQLPRPDPGKLQQLRRVDRAARQQHLAPRPGSAHDPVLRIFEAYCALALEQHAVRQCADLDAQIGPPHCGAQISHGSAAAPHVADGDLQRSDTVLLGAVKVGVEFMARLLRPGNKGVMQFVAGPQIGDAQWTANAVMLVGAAFLVLGAAEIGQYVLIRPAGIAELAPQIEILLLATDVDEPIDRARPAEHLAARPEHAAATQFAKRLGLEHPGDLRMEDVSVEPGGDVDPRVAVLAARLKQKHARRAVGGQAAGQHASGRAGPDDDEVEFSGILHACSPPNPV
jgi:hypothetical protein